LDEDPSYSAALSELRKARRAYDDFVFPISEIMAMRELPSPRPTFVLKRGAYDAPGDAVTATTPATLPPMPKNAPTNRLGLTTWLLQPDNPLFARVVVNRLWQQMFGKGLVETSDNFGRQGSAPSHPELLDWLATEFRFMNYDVKAFLKMIALSQTYRQSSVGSKDAVTKDPNNLLLARYPATRLSAEMLRDQALHTSGLLVEKIGGPSVKPYQPEGLWEMAMGKPRYDQGKGEDLYRRSLYTFVKRTVPHPQMGTFDGADRNVCTVRRQATNTPLQALALLNDTQMVEASRLLAERMMLEGGASTETRVGFAFETVAGRKPTPQELKVLARLFEEQRVIFAKDPKSAEKLLSVGEKKRNGKLDASEVAAAAQVALAILNSDSATMKR
jgi:hypothetical protein